MIQDKASSHENSFEYNPDSFENNRLIVSAIIPSTDIQHLVLSNLIHLKSQLSASKYLDWTCNSSQLGHTLIKVWTNDRIVFNDIMNSLLKSGLQPSFGSSEDMDQSHSDYSANYSLDRDLSRYPPISIASPANAKATLVLSRNEPISLGSVSKGKSPSNSDNQPPLNRKLIPVSVPPELSEQCSSEFACTEKSSLLNSVIATKAPLASLIPSQNQESFPSYQKPSQVTEESTMKAFLASLKTFRSQVEINSNHCYSNITFNLQTTSEGRVMNLEQPLQQRSEVQLRKQKRSQRVGGSCVEKLISIQIKLDISLPNSSQLAAPKEPKPQSKVDIKEKKRGSRVVFVKGIEKERTSIKQLVNLFECFGDVEIGMFHNKKEFALVKFKTPSDAKSCIKELYAKEVAGKSMLIHYSELDELTSKIYSNEKTYYQIPSSAKFDRPRKVCPLSKRLLLRLSSDPSGTSSKPALPPIAPEDIPSIFKSYLRNAQVKVSDQPNEFILEFVNTKHAMEFVMYHNCSQISYNHQKGKQTIFASTSFLPLEKKPIIAQ